LKNGAPSPQDTMMYLATPHPSKTTRYRNIPKFKKFTEEFLNVDKAVFYWGRHSGFGLLHKSWKTTCANLFQNPTLESTGESQPLSVGITKTLKKAPKDSPTQCLEATPKSGERWENVQSSAIMLLLTLTTKSVNPVNANATKFPSQNAHGSTNSERGLKHWSTQLSKKSKPTKNAPSTPAVQKWKWRCPLHWLR